MFNLKKKKKVLTLVLKLQADSKTTDHLLIL